MVQDMTSKEDINKIKEKLDTSDIDQDFWLEYNQEVFRIIDDNQFLNACNIELSNRIYNAMHRIQLLQMEGEVSIKDLGLLIKDLKGKPTVKVDKEERQVEVKYDREDGNTSSKESYVG